MHKIILTGVLMLVFGTSAYMSVSGLLAFFGGSLIVIVCLGAGLELGKILTVVHLHRPTRRSACDLARSARSRARGPSPWPPCGVPR